MTYGSGVRPDSAPTRASLLFHATDGCDIRHRTNWALDVCEARLDRKNRDKREKR